MGHLLQQHPIVTVNNSLPLPLHLKLLQLQVKMHVCFWRLGVYNWLSILHLIECVKLNEHRETFIEAI